MEVRYVNTDGAEFTMGITPPFFLTQKEGFGAIENDIITATQYGLDGAVLVNQQLAVRELKITGEMQADDVATMQQQRNLAVSVFNPQLAGTLYYNNGNSSYMIDVLIEIGPDLDTDSINLNQEFTVQFKALAPYWNDVTNFNKLIPLSGITRGFKFPMAITNGFTLAELTAGNIVKLTNDGDVASGGVFTITVITAVSNVKILNVVTQEYFMLAGPYDVGTVLMFNTRRGEKQVTKTINGITSNAMADRDLNSTFLSMAKGDNFVQVTALTADGSADNSTGLITTFEFTPLVMGV